MWICINSHMLASTAGGIPHPPIIHVALQRTVGSSRMMNDYAHPSSLSSPLARCSSKVSYRHFFFFCIIFFHAPPRSSSPILPPMVPSPDRFTPPLDPPLSFLTTSFKLWRRTDGRTCSWPKIHPSCGRHLSSQYGRASSYKQRRWGSVRRWRSPLEMYRRQEAEEETRSSNWSRSRSCPLRSRNTVAGDGALGTDSFLGSQLQLLLSSTIPTGNTKSALLSIFCLYCLLHMEPKR